MLYLANFLQPEALIRVVTTFSASSAALDQPQSTQQVARFPQRIPARETGGRGLVECLITPAATEKCAPAASLV